MSFSLGLTFPWAFGVHGVAYGSKESIKKFRLPPYIFQQLLVRVEKFHHRTSQSDSWGEEVVRGPNHLQKKNYVETRKSRKLTRYHIIIMLMSPRKNQYSSLLRIGSTWGSTSITSLKYSSTDEGFRSAGNHGWKCL